MSAKKRARAKRKKAAPRPARGAARVWWHTWAVYLTPPLASVLVFFFALKNGFVWDDFQYLLENPFMKLKWRSFFGWAFTSFYAANYHPLTWLSHRLDVALWGLEPMGHHLTSIIIHAANTLLVVHLTKRLVSLASKSKDGRLPLLAGLFAGLIFGIHPLRVESVAWVAERKDVLCALFFLLSANCYITHSLRSGAGYYRLSLLFFFLALMAKPMAVSLPVVLIILDFYPLGRLTLKGAPKNGKRVLLEKAPFVLLAAASCVLTLFAQKSGGATEAVRHAALPMRLMVAARGLVFYLEKSVAPFNLAPLYPYPANLGWAHAISGVLAAGGLVFIFLRRKERPWLAAGFSYYLITLVPVLGLVQVGQQSAADRYTYLPILGPLILASVGWARLATAETPGVRRAAAAVFVAFVLGFGLLTIRYEAHWKSTIALYNREIAVFGERAPFAYNNRGVAFERMGRFKDALLDYEKALEIKPDYPDALVNRGRLRRMMGDLEAALRDLEKAVALAPGHLKAYNSRGVVLDMMGRHEDAGAEFERALAINPYSYETQFNAALHHLEYGDIEKAERHAKRAITLSPRMVRAHELLARVRLKKGEIEEARKSLRKAMDLNPADPSPRLFMARVLMSSGRSREAIKVLDETIAVQPRLGEAYYLRGVIRLRQGQRDRGISDLKTAARLGHSRAGELLKKVGAG